MGNLNPGVTYIYERAGGIIYAREFGSSERKIVGYDAHNSPEQLRTKEQINDILQMCETDPGMKQILEQLFVMYNLKKTHE
jgi:hypothetical protein